MRAKLSLQYDFLQRFPLLQHDIPSRYTKTGILIRCQACDWEMKRAKAREFVLRRGDFDLCQWADGRLGRVVQQTINMEDA